MLPHLSLTKFNHTFKYFTLISITLQKSIAMKLAGVALIIGGWGLSGFPFCKVGTYDKLPDIIDSLEWIFGSNQYLLLQCFTETESRLPGSTCHDSTSSKLGEMIEGKAKQEGQID